MIDQYSPEWFKENMPDYYAAGGRAKVEKPAWLVAREADLEYHFRDWSVPESNRLIGIETGYIKREQARRRKEGRV